MADQKQMQQSKAPTMAEYVENITSGIMTELNKSQSKGLVLPKNYAAQNALMSAMFKIKQTVDRDKKPVLSVCSPDSIKQTVLEMLEKGLDPAKNQCYFIAYGNKLTLFESYFGVIHRAKESDPNISYIYAEVVYEKDKFAYGLKRGAKVVTLHEQSPDNIDLTKIKGAYATILYKDGSEVSEYMTWKQIQNSWSRGQTKGGSDAHKLAPEEMCKRTVLKRLVKMVVNTANDEQLMFGQKDADFEDEANEQEATEAIDVTPDDSDEPEQEEPEEEPEPDPPKKQTKAAKEQMPIDDYQQELDQDGAPLPFDL